MTKHITNEPTSCGICVLGDTPKEKKLNHSHYRFDVPREFQEVKVPRLRENGPGWW